MKRLFLLSVFLLTIIATTAQSNPTNMFSKPMQRFVDGCINLSLGVAEHNELQVGVAADLLDPDIKGETAISIGGWALKAVDDSHATQPAGDFQFTTQYARKWVDTNGIGPFNELPSNLRKGTNNTCLVYTLSVLPKSTVTMADRQNGVCQVAAVAQPGGKVNMTISYGDETMKATPLEEGLGAFAVWNMPAYQSKLVHFTIENPTDKTETIILISN